MEKKGRKTKDKNTPKRPRSAYIHFALERKKQLKEDQQDKKFDEIAEILAHQWDEMSDDEKAPYFQLEKDDKKRFEKEMNEYKLKNEKK
jgi:hypothetical protein